MGKNKSATTYVPTKPSVKPAGSGQSGYVPPKQPVKPPAKPTTGKK